jgi:hypothetical protein
MRSELLEKILKRIDMLGDVLVLDPETLRQERERAVVASKILPPGYHDIYISLRREKQFPNQPRYGQAVGALLRLIFDFNWRIYNECEHSMNNLMESYRTKERLQPQNGQHRGRMIFLAVRETKLTTTISKTNHKLAKQECPYRIWDYLWAALTDPEPFSHRSFVAVGDRVEVHRYGEYRHAPGLLVRKSSMKLEPIRLHAKPNGVDRYHLIAAKLNV